MKTALPENSGVNHEKISLSYFSISPLLHRSELLTKSSLVRLEQMPTMRPHIYFANSHEHHRIISRRQSSPWTCHGRHPRLLFRSPRSATRLRRNRCRTFWRSHDLLPKHPTLVESRSLPTLRRPRLDVPLFLVASLRLRTLPARSEKLPSIAFDRPRPP